MTSLLERPGGTRRIAVVPAYNEEPTVAQVLDKLSYLVDELVVVDDGSTDGTRAAIQEWLPGHDHCRLLSFDQNQGMSAAYYLAFTDLRRRMRSGELSPDDLVFTVDADGQHDLDVLDDLHRRTVDEKLDALLVRRDLSTYPLYKQAGNWVLSAWATLSAVGRAMGRSPARRRRVRLPHLPVGRTGRRADVLPRLQVLRDRRGRGGAVP